MIGDPAAWLRRYRSLDQRVMALVATIWPRCIADLPVQPDEDTITIQLVDALSRDPGARRLGVIEYQFEPFGHRPDGIAYSKGKIDMAVLLDRTRRRYLAYECKNFLFSRSVDRVQEIRHRWHHMRGALETLGDEEITVDFLRAAVIVTRGHTRESQVYESVQNIAKTENMALGFASTIERLAHAYVATFISSHERWNGCPQGVRNAIDVLDLLDVRAMRPLLLAAAGRFSRKELAATFRFAVALSVRLVVTGSPQGSSVEMPLAQVANLVYRREIETTDSLKKELNGIIPSDEEFRAAFETARVPRAGLARYYLRSLERAANEESEPWYLPNEDSSIINLEHVLPKKPEDKWPQFSDDEAAMYVDRLGNQALLRASDNSDVGNAGFADKRPLYEESPYRLTKMIAEAADWTPEQVIARQKRLAELALTAWPI